MQPSPAWQPSAFLDTMREAQRAAMDNLRRAQANAFDLFGYGARENAFEVAASGTHWRLRHYAGAASGGPLLLVPAPIKRPYIWDLDPSVSAVRFCLDQGFDVHLLEWIPPSDDDHAAGIEEYAEGAIAVCAAVVAERTGVTPVLLGHSLGGTLAAIACALHPSAARGLVLLGAPLAFAPGSSRFRDLVVACAAAGMPEDGVVAGSQLSQDCAFLSPAGFLWSRWMDGALCLGDPAAMDIHIRIERWALDEVALPGRLIHQIVTWLYREDQFHRGVLALSGGTIEARRGRAEARTRQAGRLALPSVRRGDDAWRFHARRPGLAPNLYPPCSGGAGYGKTQLDVIWRSGWFNIGRGRSHDEQRRG